MSPAPDMYQKKIIALLSPAERKLFKKINSPARVQDFLEALPHNFSKSAGETCRPVRQILQIPKAYCFEGALLGAALLAYHGHQPLLLDLQTIEEDDDHVVALFKENNLWGAVSKTNNPVLRYRDPVYKTIRELAMSYFHEYFLYKDGRKTMRAYSKPFDLTKYKPEVWVAGKESVAFIAEELDASPHFPVAPTKAIKKLRPATILERKVLDLEHYKRKSRP
ncbi:MAG: hypothetical protein KBD50_00035 [Candidatus Pacebacteria bacterium]|nr:hypothetical protein [Candidatus Paceibacterota bacterium]